MPDVKYVILSIDSLNVLVRYAKYEKQMVLICTSSNLCSHTFCSTC